MERKNLGCFAESRAGHDRGRIYIIIGEKGGLIELADGKKKTVENPKRKNRKHIVVSRHEASAAISEKLFHDLSVTNEDVKRAIKCYHQRKESPNA
ncbi:MAG: KOW domain-containing RNA-binding protein [Lachnospiraceae bacterium]|jgi:hypothetical protein|nr:KOW domain-containing RNA-binding protein [Lachnospiraceae bacterium]